VRCLALLVREGGGLLFSGGADSEVRIWDLRDRGNLVLLNTLYDVMPVNSVAVAARPGSSRGAGVCGGSSEWPELEVYTACGSNSDCSEIRCWRGQGPCDDFRLIVLPGHRDYVLCLLSEAAGGEGVSGAGALLYSSAADRTLLVWDDQHRLVAGREVRMAVSCMLVYNDILYTGSLDNTLIHCK
jgi:WD40 repeat protein